MARTRKSTRKSPRKSTAGKGKRVKKSKSKGKGKGRKSVPPKRPRKEEEEDDQVQKVDNNNNINKKKKTQKKKQQGKKKKGGLVKDDNKRGKKRVKQTKQTVESAWEAFGKNENAKTTIDLVNKLNFSVRSRMPISAILKAVDPAVQQQFFGVISDGEKIENFSWSLEQYTQYLFLLVKLFQSLSVDIVRDSLLPLVNLPLWDNLNAPTLEHLPKALARHWRIYQKQKAKGKKDFTKFREFFPKLMSKFFTVLNSLGIKDFDTESRFLERFIELCIDLVCQLPTRRFFRQYLVDSNLIIRFKLSRYFNQSAFKKSLLSLLIIQKLDYYIRFEVDDFSGQALTVSEMEQRRSVKLDRFQRTAFAMSSGDIEGVDESDYEELKNLALSHQSALTFVKVAKVAEALSFESLKILAHSSGLASQTITDKTTLGLILADFCKTRKYHLDRINQMSLYPTEELLWSSVLAKGQDYDYDRPLNLPKLNLQFLSFYDYLLRNYTLYRFEASYGLKADVTTVISRMKPELLSDGKIKFNGWANLALPIKGVVKIFHVGEPVVGGTNPSEVRAELNFSLHHFTGRVRGEWEELKARDVLFLLQIGDPDTDEENTNQSRKYGLERLRGCEIVDAGEGTERRMIIKLDPAQYQSDVTAGLVYSGLNIVMRRRPAKNTFKAVLDTMRGLLNEHKYAIPPWLHDTFLGFGDPSQAVPTIHDGLTIDFGDTFLDAQHVVEAFPDREVEVKGSPPYVVSFLEGNKVVAETSEKEFEISNKLRFTPLQVKAISKGVQPGLSLIVGPPGTGKTDTASQILSLLYHSYPEQRIVVITHSNDALDQLFQRLANMKDVDQSSLVRLGYRHITNGKDYSRDGRVQLLLQKRNHFLQEINRLSQSLGLGSQVAFTCETAAHFFFLNIQPLWDQYEAKFQNSKDLENDSAFKEFPFSTYFATESKMKGQSVEEDFKEAHRLFNKVQNLLKELKNCEAMEVLRNDWDRGNFLLAKHSRVVAMTCTYAAMARNALVSVNFKFDSLVMEEAAQVMEIETFIPLMLQESKNMEDINRLKRVVLLGDHNQLPPIIQNSAFAQYCNLDQSFFTRFVRLGVPTTELDQQGRCRSDLARLFSWRYDRLDNLAVNVSKFTNANAGLRHNFQLIDVPDYQGVGEFCPSPYYYQNLGEAEYVVAVYRYLRILGYPASKITILTTYNGQKHLIKDVVNRYCGKGTRYGFPAKISTVDKFQGQENDIILLSLVRTKRIGHIQDIRRLIVAASRARLGLYVFARKSLFSGVPSLKPVFDQLNENSNELALIPTERHPTQRLDGGEVDEKSVIEIYDVEKMQLLVSDMEKSSQVK